MKQRTWVAILGVVFVAAYASIMTIQALVWDPLAAVPGQSLAQVHAHLLADGMNVTSDNVSVIVSAAIGVALAVGVGVIGLWRRLSLPIMSVMFLALVALGAVVTFGSGFALGMDVAESYGVGGEDHTIWAGVLYTVSLIALFGLVAVLTVTVIRNSRSGQAGPLAA